MDQIGLGDVCHTALGDHGSLPEHKDPVADLDQIGELGGAEHDRRAALRQLSYDLVDRSLGGHIDPSRRIVEKKHGRFSREPTGDDHLLLVSPAEAVDLLIDGGSGDCESRAFFAREVPHSLRVDQTEPAAPLILKASKGYDVEAFVEGLKGRGIAPHVAINGRVSKIGKARKTGVPSEVAASLRYAVSQRLRKRIEEGFGWMKTVGGLAQVKVRGLDKVRAAFVFAMAAYNIVRLPKLLAPRGEVRPAT